MIEKGYTLSEQVAIGCIKWQTRSGHMGRVRREEIREGAETVRREINKRREREKKEERMKKKREERKKGRDIWQHQNRARYKYRASFNMMKIVYNNLKIQL